MFPTFLIICLTGFVRLRFSLRGPFYFSLATAKLCGRALPLQPPNVDTLSRLLWFCLVTVPQRFPPLGFVICGVRSTCASAGVFWRLGRSPAAVQLRERLNCNAAWSFVSPVFLFLCSRTRTLLWDLFQPCFCLTLKASVKRVWLLPRSLFS